MVWRLYPQFRDTIRIDGRLTTIADYVAESCGQKVGPAAATCLAETGEQAQLELRREQGKSVLFIVAPLVLYLALWGGRRLVRGRTQSP